MNDGSSVMPAIFIIGYSRVGHVPVDVNKELHDMLQYTPTLPALEGRPKSMYSDIDPLTQHPPEFTFKNRLCIKFGVNFISRCIYEEIQYVNGI